MGLFEKPYKTENTKEQGIHRIARIYKYKNGYGASVIRSKFYKPKTLKLNLFPQGYISYTKNENEWELAVIYKFEPAAKRGIQQASSTLYASHASRGQRQRREEYQICYSTKITSDVIGNLTKPQVEKILKQIKALKPY